MSDQTIDLGAQTKPRGKSRRKKLLEQAVLFGVVALIFYFIFRRVKIEEVLGALGKVQPLRFFALSLVFVAATVLLDIYTHFALFRRFGFGFGLGAMGRLRVANLLFSSLGFLYGQGGMAYMASRDSGRPAAQVAGLLAFLFFCSFHAALLWVTLAMAVLLPMLDAARSFRWLWVWILADWPVFVIWVWFWQTRFKNYVPARLRQSILYAFEQARPARYLEFISLRSLHFFLIAACVWLALPAMGMEIPFRAVLGILPIQGIIIAIPTPGKYGVNEGAFLLLFGKWAKAANLVAFGLLWGTSANLIRSLLSLAAVRTLKGK